MTITDEVWVNTLTGFRTCKIILICARQAIWSRLGAGCLTGMRIGYFFVLLREPFRFVGADELGTEMSVVDRELFRVKV